MTSDNPTAAEGLAAMRQVQDFIDNEPALEHNCPGADCAKCRRRLAAFQATSLAITALRRPIPAGDDLVEVVARARAVIARWNQRIANELSSNREFPWAEDDDHLYQQLGDALEWLSAAPLRAALTAIGPRAGEVERLREALELIAGPPERDPDLPPIYQPRWSHGQCRDIARAALAHTPEAEQ